MKRAQQNVGIDQEEAERRRQESRKVAEDRDRARRQEEEKKREFKAKMDAKMKEVIKKRSKKGIWDQYQYHIIFGALGLLFLFAIVGKSSGESRKAADIQVIEEDFINQVNAQNRGYTVDANSFFEGWSLQDVKGILKNGVTKKKSVPRCQVNSNELSSDKYNFYEKHPNCLSEPANQGNCSSSFAFAATGIFNDRVCLDNNDAKVFRASPQHPLACDKVSSKGCQGGFVAGALDLGRLAGFVSEDCLGYDAGKADECEAKDLTQCKRYNVADYCVLEGVNEIKTQLAASGPVAAMIQVTKEFLVYKDGIYDETMSDYKLEGLQAVKIIGWDATSSGTAYWIIENSWGSSWGQNGIAHVKMNIIDSMLDKFAVSTTVADPEKKAEQQPPQQDE